MYIDLMARMPLGMSLAEAARGWLDGVLAEVFPDVREGLRARPSARSISTHFDDRPDGDPGEVRGELEIVRAGKRPRAILFSEVSWQRFLASLDESFQSASITARVVGEDGYLSNGEAFIAVRRRDDEADWLRFEFSASASYTWRGHVAEDPGPGDATVKVLRWVPGGRVQEVIERPADAVDLVAPGPGGGWAGSAELQGRWAQIVMGQAERLGASAGMITRWRGPRGIGKLTYLDWPPRRVIQPAGRAADTGMLSPDGQALHRFSWVTIIPPEAAARLGSAAALRQTGAFFDVTELPGGPLWLRATPTIEEFTPGHFEMVAEALAPILVHAETY